MNLRRPYSLRTKVFAGILIVTAVTLSVYLSRGNSLTVVTGKIVGAGDEKSSPDSAALPMMTHSSQTGEIKSWSVVQDVSVELFNSGSKSTTTQIHLRGTLDEELAEIAGGRRVYRYVLRDADFQSTDASGNPAMPEAEVKGVEKALSDAVVLVRTDDQRRELRFSAARGTSLETLNLLRSVIYSGSVYLPASKKLTEWTSQETDSTGVFTLNNKLTAMSGETATIEKEPRMVRMPESSAAMNGQGDAVAVLPASLTRVTFDAKAGHLLKAEQRWTLRFSAAGIYATTNILTRLEFIGRQPATARSKDKNPEFAGAAGGQDFVTELELESASDQNIKRKVAAQTLAGESWNSLREKLRDAELHKDGSARFNLLEQLSALMFLQPEICFEVAGFIAGLKKEDPLYASQLSLLSGAFANQETPEAETAIAGLSQSMSQDEEALMQIIPAMGSHRRPSEKMRDALLKQYEGGISQAVKSTSTLALGTFANRAQKARPDLTDEAVSRLKQDFDAAPQVDRQVNISGALGNAGAKETLPSVKTLMEKTKDPAFQRSALYDLRFVADPEVDSLLQRLSLDPQTEPDLVIQSFRIMRMRPPVRGNFDAALKTARAANARTTVRVEAIHAVSHHAALSPAEVAEALAEFGRDSNPQVVQQAKQLAVKLPRTGN
ncbi:MAG: hypothetical protein EBR09_14185 [Proteobacteria bacterium]|nr:hypothetical protein [Pseudomonadota bacterium]